ncbi:cobaltochelatase subunit CobN [Arenicella xantha]|uniref:Cobaltochelatase CobN subunit n=1 Tax=Arenicella xantha TaxID=644221 RepID=A0A395JT71_9GAMM|nr:cobaltochelatase subunit CobN [Arenicella xantha]RBP53686.1 cobaltochelatase CobN subunit [Arenicella xantha]
MVVVRHILKRQVWKFLVTKFILISLLCFSNAVSAVNILAVVSPRNTADVLSGAHQFLRENPTHKIILRTTDQFSDLPEAKRRELLSAADIVFVGGVFGDPVNTFERYVADAKLIKSFVAVHSDRKLVTASHRNQQSMLAGANIDELMKDPPAGPNNDAMQWSATRLEQFSEYRSWLLAKTYWSDRDTDNMNGLFRHLAALAGVSISVPTPTVHQPLRMFIDDKPIDAQNVALSTDFKWVAIVDYETGGRPGERALIDQICGELSAKTLDGEVKCLRVLAKWGAPTVRAVELLAQQKGRLSAIVSLQNFVLGGGDGRAAVNASLAELGVPVIKGLRLTDVTADEWRVSEEGLRWDSVHYRVAMPELQGVSQPLVVAAMTSASIDPQTGVKLALSKPIESQVSLLSRRVKRWITLQTKANSDKKIAIIYYNHPPGRHNIGADNLNVPESLLGILTHLKRQGYDTGELPKTRQALLDLLQDRGVNLPEDRGALAAMSNKVTTISAPQYQQWFDELPPLIQDEMQNGPLGYLHVMLKTAMTFDDPETAQRLVRRVSEDLKHALEGADHAARDRVIDLLAQLQTVYQSSKVDWNQAERLTNAIAESGIEGLRGWGQAPGKVMVHNNELLIPGIQFGNVFVGPQPPRGWELNEEILHANLSFPPTHQYLAFYQWLRHDFQADALVHLGRHSTYEFLPRHRVGMGEVDYPLALIDDLPSVYPYIVDGVGEGIQAKRRGLAVMVDHLTPPLESTELYDRLLELRQLVESYETAPEAAGAMRHRAIVAIKQLVDELKLSDELTKSMEGELEIRGVSAYDQVDDELLVHEVGHYLTKLQEDFMPLGLHSFGQDWSPQAISTMLTSMQQGGERGADWHTKLSRSPQAEMQALENGLNGHYVQPGKGNDPIRTPEVLPTGRNFYALDGGLIPSRLGYEVGVELATKARSLTHTNETTESDAIVLWASDVVRDEGAMIAFGFDMLGIKPVWSSRGIVQRLERLDIANLTENGAPRTRRDTLYTTSGLFRDLYGAHIAWLEQAVLMALDASSDEIRSRYPALSLALNAALSPLGELQNPGKEPLAINHVAKQWVADARANLQAGISAELAGRQATYRIFGDAPGAYGAGVNRMVERSGSWQHRSEIGAVYLRRMGHAYGATLHGEPQQGLFKRRISQVGNTYLGRSSNLYGLLDNNDTFDYLGGLSLAVETTKGRVPENFILAHADSTKISVEPLSVALLSELRGRFLNPQWLTPLMDEGYAGARTMGSEFFEYLWGWQVTNPDVVKSWVWDDVKSVYIDDKHQIGLSDFLQQNHNVHVKSNMLAVMLVAAQKQFWQADEATLRQLSAQFAELIIQHGLPGSGHTSPNNPVFDFLKDHVSEQQFAQVQQVLDAARVDSSVASAPSTISELKEADLAPAQQADSNNQQAQQADQSQTVFQDYRWLILLFVCLIAVGIIRGMRTPKINNKD